jgi:hypothetical protein
VAGGGSRGTPRWGEPTSSRGELQGAVHQVKQVQEGVTGDQCFTAMCMIWSTVQLQGRLYDRCGPACRCTCATSKLGSAHVEDMHHRRSVALLTRAMGRNDSSLRATAPVQVCRICGARASEPGQTDRCML